jgi:hypothetical protein
MVGARLVQELVEVVVSQRALVLALGGRDLTSGRRSAVLLVLPVLAARGRSVAVAPLLFRLALVTLKDGPDRLLAGGMVGGDLQELVRGARLLAPQFVDQGLAVRPTEERTDDVGVDDARQRVALLGEASDIVAQGLSGLLLAALEVPRVARAHVRALEVAYEDLSEVYPAADGVGG